MKEEPFQPLPCKGTVFFDLCKSLLKFLARKTERQKNSLSRPRTRADED